MGLNCKGISFDFGIRMFDFGFDWSDILNRFIFRPLELKIIRISMRIRGNANPKSEHPKSEITILLPDQDPNLR